MNKCFQLFFVFILYSSIHAQTYGKLYTKSEADNLYGPVLSSVTINTSDLNLIIEKANNYIMFNILNGKLVILGEGRHLLSPENIQVDEKAVFKMYSISLVKELLSKGQDKTTTIENRKNVLSITNGEYTLEYAADCPPNCIY